MKGITPPPFLDRHGVKPGEVVYVCPTVTCRQPHETREEYLAHWDTVHRQLDQPRPAPTPAAAAWEEGFRAGQTHERSMWQWQAGPIARAVNGLTHRPERPTNPHAKETVDAQG